MNGPINIGIDWRVRWPSGELLDINANVGVRLANGSGRGFVCMTMTACPEFFCEIAIGSIDTLDHHALSSPKRWFDGRVT